MTKPSITLTVKKGVTVVRDGKRVRPELNKTFDFTADERDSILTVDPAALVKPDGGEAAGEGEDVGTSGTGSSAESSQAKARGGRKAATANKSDAETKTTEPPAGEPAKTGDDAEGGEGAAGGASGEDDDL